MSAKIFLSKLKESSISVLPITFLIILLVFLLVENPLQLILQILLCSIILIIGISFFSLGADSSMIELGGSVGTTFSKSKKLAFVVICALLIGFIITFAEPDLMVLAKQVVDFSSLDSIWIFISVVSLGVGILLILGILRIIYNIKLSILLTILYSIVFILSFIIPNQFVFISFDSGSVTTGPVSVPFLISFGLGLSAVKKSKKDEDTNFGLISLCSVGPLITVMILSLFLDTTGNITNETITQNASMLEQLLLTFKDCLLDVLIILVPILTLFTIFQIFSFKYPKTKIIRMCFGFFMTYIGISLFLTGVEFCYLPLGKLIGESLSQLSHNWIAVPIGFIVGAFAIIAEPSLHVLKKQVEDITNNAIKQKVITITVSLGVALAVGISIISALFPFNLLYVLLPVYVISILLAYFNSEIFTSIAFDSGGVATGTMAVSFILPMVTGLSQAKNGFGAIALVACFPILIVQILGFIYRIKVYKIENLQISNQLKKNYVIEFDYEKNYSPSKTKPDSIIEFDYIKGVK